MKSEMARLMNTCDESIDSFEIEELNSARKLIKPGKATVLDGIHPELVKNIGGTAKSWILARFNSCATENQEW